MEKDLYSISHKNLRLQRSGNFKAIIMLWSLATLVNKFMPRKISMHISILFEIQCFRNLAGIQLVMREAERKLPGSSRVLIKV